ncbi:MAG: tetratricopeptide repeat protein [Chloroflexi bacterium]|nr:tetratricopeptide repeat protein [Chloroflexota bacterium]
MKTAEQIRNTIQQIEAQRALLGDEAADTAITALIKELDNLPSPVPEQRRRQVSVLFADLSGFTALSEKADAEEVTDLLNELWSRLDAVVLRCGGAVDKHIGDALMAVWGLHTVRENDPEQAVLAALELQDQMGAFFRERGHSLRLHIGVNTGPALVGAVGSKAEYTAIGDTVNVTSRLASAAQPGETLISKSTYRHIRGIFEVEETEALQLKGRNEVVQAYRVLRRRERPFRSLTRGLEGGIPPLVGRRPQLDDIKQCFESAVAQARGMAVTLVGEAGIGKSRLLFEVEDWLDLLPQRITYFRARSHPSIQHSPYSFLRDLFMRRFEIQESDPTEQARAKLSNGIQAVLDDPEGGMKADFIGYLLGFDLRASPHIQAALTDARQVRDRGLRYLLEYFQALAAQRPLVISLDDLHWADRSSLEFIQQLLRETDGASLFLLATARPALAEQFPAWLEQPRQVRIDLGPLDQADCLALVDSLLSRVRNLPPELRQAIAAQSDGNPFYVEELIKMLMEDGVILTEGSEWRIADGRALQWHIPSSLMEVLQTRLENLPPAENELLQQASVVGRTFWQSALQYMGRQLPQPQPVDLNESLNNLEMRELVFHQKISRFEETLEYIFKHSILRDVAYETTLLRKRRLYHRLAAEWYLQHSAEWSDEFDSVIAVHLEAANDAERAAVYFLKAGIHAANKYSNQEALRHLGRALDLTPPNRSGPRFDILVAREKVYNTLGQREAQSHDLEEMAGLAAQGSLQQRVTAALRQANHAMLTSQYPQAILHAGTAVRLAQEAGDTQGQADGLTLWGQTLVYQGNSDQAVQVLQQGIEISRQNGLRLSEARALSSLGSCQYFEGNLQSGRVSIEQALSIAAEIGGQQRLEIEMLNRLGSVQAELGDYPSSEACFQRGIDLCRLIGDREGESMLLGNIGANYSDQGDLWNAQLFFQQSLEISEKVGQRFYAGNAILNLGLVDNSVGDFESAAQRLEQALAVYREIGNLRSEGMALSHYGQINHARGQQQLALDQSTAALEIARSLNNRYVQAYALTNLGNIQTALGRFEEAAAHYREALTLRREIGQIPLYIESICGLLALHHLHGRLPEVHAEMEEALAALRDRPYLEMANEPMRAYLACIRALHALNDPRASALLEQAQRVLGEQAGRISHPEMRAAFLNVPVNRAILEYRLD